MARRPNTLRKKPTKVASATKKRKKTSPIPKNVNTRFMFAKKKTNRKTV